MNLKSKLPLKFQKYSSFGIFLKIIFLPFALSFIALILLVRPLVVIKFFKVNPWRIGHLLAEVEIVRLILEEDNASDNVSDAHRGIARDIARVNGHAAIVELLNEAWS